MNFIMVFATFYILLWPFYFRICTYSLLFYSTKYEIDQEHLKSFIAELNFPFKMLDLRIYQNSGLIGMGALNLVKNLDELKQQNLNLRNIRLSCSVIPTLNIAFWLVILPFSKSSEDLFACLMLIFANLITLVVTWRFGHSLVWYK